MPTSTLDPFWEQWNAESWDELSEQRSYSMERPRLYPGDIICGDYEVLALSGAGATSYVYRCRQRDGQTCAVKVLHADLVHHPGARMRFLREAHTTLGLHHENVVVAHEIVDFPGVVAYAMDHVQGPNLREWRKLHAPCTDEELFGILFDVIAGLEHVHAHGLIHRDIKPANILMDVSGARPVARIIDFGVARLADQEPDEEDLQTIRGTAGYISPEEIRSAHEVCASSDLYSLGVVMYELACGTRPFVGRPHQELFKAHLYEKPVPPGVHNPTIHPALEVVILKMLSKSPELRYGSVEALREALAAALDLSSELEALPAFVPEEEEDPRAQRQWTYFAQVMMAALLTLLLNPGVTNTDDDPHYANRDYTDFPGVF